MAMAERKLPKARRSGSRGPAPAMAARPDAGEELSWEAAIGLFMAGWRADHPGIRPATLGHYREQLVNRIASFAEEQGIASVRDLSRRELRAFVGWLDAYVTYSGRQLTPRGKQMALEAARRFLWWLYHEELLPEDISTQVARYRLDRGPEPRATPSADLEKVLYSLDLGRPTGLRNTVMIHLMALCGLRVSELVGLDASDLSLTDGRVRVRAETSKVRRTRFVDLPLVICEGREMVKPEVAQLMASWLRLRAQACPHLGQQDALFVTLGPSRSPHSILSTGGTGPNARPRGRRMTTHAVRLILGRAAAKAGVDPKLVTPHRLRHYFGLTSAMAGVPTTALMRAMGHRSPLMTARYSEFADAERRWAFAKADIAKGISLHGPRRSEGADSDTQVASSDTERRASSAVVAPVR